MTKREAQQRHAAHVAAVGAGKVSTAAGTLGEYLSRWLDSRSATWAATTARRNATIVRQLPESLTAIRLRDLTRGDVQRYVDSLTATSTPAGVRRVHAVLTGALGDAVRNGDEGLAANPAAGVRLPSDHRPRGDAADRRRAAADTRAGWPPGRAVGRPLHLRCVHGSAPWRAGCASLGRCRRPRRREGVGQRGDRHEGRRLAPPGRLKGTKTHATRPVPAGGASAACGRQVVGQQQATGRTLPPSSSARPTTGSRPVHPDHVSKVFAELAEAAGAPGSELEGSPLLCGHGARQLVPG